MGFRTAAAGLLLLLWGLGWAVTGDALKPREVPWSDGERLVYSLRWKGLVVGQQVLEAHRVGRGWHYVGRVENQGLTQLVGFDLAVDSYVRPDLFTRKFWRWLRVPGEGERTLTAVAGKETSVRFVWVDGSVHHMRDPRTDVLDDASVLYYVRVYPETRSLWLVNYPSLVGGSLRSLGRRRLNTPLGRLEADGYLFEQEEMKIEVWYSRTPERWPLRFFLGGPWGGLSSELVRVETAP